MAKSNLLNGNSLKLIQQILLMRWLISWTWLRWNIVKVLRHGISGKENSFTWVKIFGCFPFGKFFHWNYLHEHFPYIICIDVKENFKIGRRGLKWIIRCAFPNWLNKISLGKIEKIFFAIKFNVGSCNVDKFSKTFQTNFLSWFVTNIIIEIG